MKSKSLLSIAAYLGEVDRMNFRPYSKDDILPFTHICPIPAATCSSFITQKLSTCFRNEKINFSLSASLAL